MKKHPTRTLAVVAAVATLTAQSSLASAAECVFPFPTISDEDEDEDDGGPGGRECREGSSAARVVHFLGVSVGYSLFVDMTSGTIGAVAYGIDENGNVLSGAATAVADKDRDFNEFEGADASELFGNGASGFVPNQRFYDHPIDMAATYVAVF